MRQTLRQIVAVLALAGIAMNFVPSTFAATSSDVAAANTLGAAGIIVDHSANTAEYRLLDTITRQEAIGTAVKAAGFTLADDYVCQNKFSDVTESWVCRAAEVAYANGITNPAGMKFRPKDTLNRYEAMVFALKSSCVNPTDASTGTTNVDQTIARAVEAGIISSAAGFNPNAAATRGEFFRYVAGAWDYAMDNTDEMDETLPNCEEKIADIESCDTDPASCATTSGTSTTSSTVSNLSVGLASSQPTGAIVAGQATAPLLAVKVSGTGTLQTLTLKRSGISDQNTLTNVYLYDGAARLTDGYSFNNAGELTMNNLGLAISGSRNLWVLADVYASAPSGQTIAVAVTGVRANAETTVSAASVQGNLLSVASGSTLASFGKDGSNTVSLATVNAGTSSYAVWRQAFQVNTRSLSLKAANFRISGSAPVDALQNVGLYVDGVKAGSNGVMTTATGSNYISFDMAAAPLNLTTGSHTLEVRADVVKGSSFNFTVSLQQASDIMVFDPQVGVNVATCGNTSCSTSFSASTAGQISIGSGSFTAVLEPTFQTFTNVTGGSSNTVIAKFKIRGYGEDVKVTSLPVTPVLGGSTPAAAGLQNVTLFFNGSQVGSQQSWTAGALTFNLGSQMIIPAGVDSFLEVRADLRTTGGANYTAGTISANLGVATAEGQNSKSSITGPTATGNTLTIQTGLLAVAKNAGYANQTQNPNTAAVKIGSFVLQNQSSSEAVRVTSLTVALTGSTSLTNLSGLRTSETSGSGATPIQPQVTNTFSVDFTLAAGATKTIDIIADTSSQTSVTAITTLAVTAIGATSNTTTSVAAVTGQTIALSAGTVATPTLTASSSTAAQFIAAAGGSADATKGTFNFVSNGGASTITELKFTISGTGVTPVTSVKVGTVSAPVVAGIAWLQGLNIAVPNGGSGVSVDATLSYSDVGTNGEAPGATAIGSLTYVKYTSGGATATITPSVAANTMTLVGSKPTVTISSTQGSGLSISSESKIGEVTISADAKGNIKVNDVVFTVSSSGFSTAPTAIGSPRIADGSTTISGTTCTPASLVVTCEFGSTSNADFDGYTIAAGTSKTFNLYGTLTGAAAVGSGTPIISSSVGSATFNWDDASTNGVSGTALTGSGIYNFPTGSYSTKQ